MKHPDITSRILHRLAGIYGATVKALTDDTIIRIDGGPAERPSATTHDPPGKRGAPSAETPTSPPSSTTQRHTRTRWPDHGDHVPNGPATDTTSRILHRLATELTRQQLDALLLRNSGGPGRHVSYQTIANRLGITKQAAHGLVARAQLRAERIHAEETNRHRPGRKTTPQDRRDRS